MFKLALKETNNLIEGVAMGRKPRAESPMLIQNIGQKGHNSQLIFYDDEDREKYEQSLRKACKENGIVLLALVLMGNHIHALFFGSIGKCAGVFESIGASYVRWFNRKYARTGSLWNDRYYSKPVTNKQQLLDTAAYIFNNPVKAEIVKNAEDYAWSSYSELENPSDNSLAYELLDELVSIDYLKKYIKDKAKAEETDCERKCCETIPENPVSDQHVIDEVIKFVKKKNLGRIPQLSENLLKCLVKKLLKFGSNINQISRVTGLSRYRIVILCN